MPVSLYLFFLFVWVLALVLVFVLVLIFVHLLPQVAVLVLRGFCFQIAAGRASQ